MASDGGGTRANRLLGALPRETYQQLLPFLQPIALNARHSLYRTGEPIGHVYFPTTAVISVFTELRGGMQVEVATVGNEGLVGLPVFFGVDSITGTVLCQIPGEALQMPAAAFRRTVVAPHPLHGRLQRYTQAFITQVGQGVACNRIHRSEQRCARWLLTAHDQVGADTFPLTHEFLAQMLGIRRATVTEVIGALREAGAVEQQRGRVTIVNRRALEAAVCECYGIIRDEFDRLLG